ncbi:MAG: hypothetical protein JWN70_5532 [Planctomycetaceae bacterium]|nr:hypothetical protein [Planctomycetaceae bacterium]
MGPPELPTYPLGSLPELGNSVNRGLKEFMDSTRTAQGRAYEFSKLAALWLLRQSGLNRPMSKNRRPDPRARDRPTGINQEEFFATDGHR